MDYKGYKELKCYIEACSLRKYISHSSKKFPLHEKFLLAAQIIDSSRSATANMAEGYGRNTYSDTRNFFIIARGSTAETMEHLTIAFDENYTSEQELTEGEQKCELVLKLTNGYISCLDTSNKQKSNPRPKDNFKPKVPDFQSPIPNS